MIIIKKLLTRHSKIGLPPGTPIYTGHAKEIETEINVIDYNKSEYFERDHVNLKFKYNEIPEGFVRWVKVTGLATQDILEKLCNSFKLHPLVIEDILNPFQRPKFEDYGDYIFIVLKMINFKLGKIIVEQVSIILGANFVLSFEEQKSKVFNIIIDRIKIPKGQVRFKGPDYLMYVIIDVVVDNYFLIIEDFGLIIEQIEDVLVYNPKPEVLQQIYDLKREMIEIRKSIWPLRELINRLQREDSKLISDELQLYLRDIYDHIFRITDLMENYREIIFGMLDMYLSSVSNKMNDIMKVLTIISTVFIPLSFLTGFYGMNFQNMPELTNPFSYPILIGVMISIFSIMLIYFRKRKWI